MSEQARSVVSRVREEAISRGDVTLFDELVDPDIVYRGPILLPEVRGREAMWQAIEGFRAVLPDLAETVEAQWADGEWVTTRFGTTGTHRGAFMAGAPTGWTAGRSTSAGWSTRRSSSYRQCSTPWTCCRCSRP